MLSSTCPCCGQHFLRSKFTLRCLHVICHECIGMMKDLLLSVKGRSEASAASDDLGRVLCPFCNVLTEVDLGESRSLTAGRDFAHFPSSRVSLGLILERLFALRRTIRDGIVAAERRKFEMAAWLTTSAAEGRPGRADFGRSLPTLRSRKMRAMHKLVERLCLLRQCLSDVDFLSQVLDGSVRSTEDNDDELDMETKVGLASERLLAIGQILDKMNLDPLTTKTRWSTDDGLSKCCLEVSSPLYERVMCRVPIVFFDQENQIMGGVDLERLSISIVVGDTPCTQIALARSSSAPHFPLDAPGAWIHLRFVPPRSGRAFLRLFYEGHEMTGVFPSSFDIWPLSLERTWPGAELSRPLSQCSV